jgi:exonuclease SbcC
MCHNESHIDFNKFSAATIIGKTKDNLALSNGTGKTSIFKALDFVLFNEYPTNKAEKIVRDGADVCKVIFEFQIDSNIYRITRLRNRKSKKEIKLDQLIDNNWVSLSQKTDKETEVEIQKLIKINYTSFKNSILFAQGDLSGLASATATERRQLLKEPLQLAIYSKFEEVSKKKKQKVEQDISGVLSLIKNIGNPSEDIISFQENLDKNNEKIASLTKKLSLEKTIQDDFKSKITLLNDKLNKNNSDLKSKLSLLNNKKTKLLSNISECDLNINKDLKSLKNAQSSIPVQENLYNHFLQIQEQLNTTSHRASEDIKKDIIDLEDKIKKGYIVASKVEVEIETYSKQLPEEATCPECLQNISHEHREKLQTEYSEKFKESTEKHKKYTERLRKAEIDLKKLKQELDELNSFNLKFQKNQNDLDSSKRTIENFKSSIEAYTLIIDSNTNKKEEYCLELESLNKDINELITEIESTNDVDLKNELSNLEIKLKEVSFTINGIEKEITKCNVETGILEKSISFSKDNILKLKDLEDQRDILNNKLVVHNKIVEAFGSKGIPNMIINTILNDLQLESNKLLQEIRPDMEMFFITEKDEKETLDIIYRVKGKERDYSELSGGQKMMVALCLKLGLSTVIQRRLGYDIKFLLLDEVDQPLDKATTIAFSDVIKSWQDKFKILVITHNDWLKDRFNHAIIVNSTDDGSFAQVLEN